MPRSDGGDVWSVVRISLPPAEEASGSEVHADERPATPGDPRTASEQNIGLWAPGAG